MSVCDLTIDDPNKRPFWNSFIKQKSKGLWLPKNTHFRGSELCQDNNSWFSIKEIKRPNTIPSKIVIKESEKTEIRARKIMIYPTATQKKILRKWFGCARYIYNNALDKINKKEILPYKWKGIKADILNSIPEWSKETPYQVRGDCVKEVCTAVLNSYERHKETQKNHKVNFKNKKKKDCSINIPNTSVSLKGVYPRILGEMKFSESFEKPTKDCRLIYKHPGNYYLCIPEVRICTSQESSENQRLSQCVALDPGIRTFQTFYSTKRCGKIGNYEIKRIERLCKYLDKINSEYSKTKKKTLPKACARLRHRIRNLVDEVHWKTIKYLTSNFSRIFIPKFETSKMVTKLHSKVARAMLTWSHYRFRMRLEIKALETGTRVYIVNEAYTTKTCTQCGILNNKIGTKKVFKCPNCSLKGDRDILAARNIFLRTIGQPRFKVRGAEVRKDGSIG